MSSTGAELGTLCEVLDQRLKRREDYYPGHDEPDWSLLQEALAAVVDRLWTCASVEPARRPPAELEALAARPIFVVGYYKSGTSLVLNLLDNHPELIALPGEWRYFTSFADLASDRDAAARQLHRRAIGNAITPYGLRPHWLLGTPTRVPDRYDELGRLVVAFARAREGRDALAAAAQAFAHVTGSTARAWVEKTPLQELHLERILAAYPEARFVHVVRDPRSTIESIAEFGGVPIVDPLTGAAELSRSFRAAVAGRRSLGERYMVIRYEELVGDTEATMRSVAAALGITYADSLLVPTALGLPATANAGRRERRVAGVVHALSLDRPNRLPHRDRLIVQALAGRPARALGYDTGGGSRLVALGARTLLFARYRLRARLAERSS